MKHTIISAALVLATAPTFSQATTFEDAAGATGYDLRQDSRIEAAANIANSAYDRTQIIETHVTATDAANARQDIQIGNAQSDIMQNTLDIERNHQLVNGTVQAVSNETAARKAADADLQNQVSGVASQVVSNTDAITAETTARISADKSLSHELMDETKQRTSADDALQAEIKATHAAVGRETAARTDADADLQKEIKANHSSIGRETAERIAGDTANQMKAEDAQNTARDAIVMGTANAQSIANNESHITTVEAKADDAQATAQGNARMLSQTTNSRYQSMKVTEPAKEAIDGKNGLDGAQGATGQNGVDGKDGVTTVVTKHEVDATTKKAVATNTQNIDLIRGDVVTHSHAAYTQATTDSNAYTNQKFSQLKSTVDDNKKEASAGISGAMAMASIPQVLQSQDVAVGAGVGGYDSESAIAVGVSFRASESVTVKTAVSDDTQNNFGYGAGVSFGW